MTKKEAVPLQSEQALFHGTGPAVAVSRHPGEREVREDMAQLFRVGQQISQVEEALGLGALHRLDHGAQIPVRVG